MAYLKMTIAEVLRHTNDDSAARRELSIPEENQEWFDTAAISVSLEQAGKLGILKDLYERNHTDNGKTIPIDIFEEVYGQLESARNLMVGVCFDPRIPIEMKESLQAKSKNIDSILKKYSSLVG